MDSSKPLLSLFFKAYFFSHVFLISFAKAYGSIGLCGSGSKLFLFHLLHLLHRNVVFCAVMVLVKRGIGVKMIILMQPYLSKWLFMLGEAL